MRKVSPKEKSLSTESMISKMVDARVRGVVVENVVPYSSWFQRVHKEDLLKYAKDLGIVVYSKAQKKDIIDLLANETVNIESKKEHLSFKEEERVTLGAMIEVIGEQGLKITPVYGVMLGNVFIPVRIDFENGDKVHFYNFENIMTYLSGVFASLKVQKDLKVKSLLDTVKEA